MPAALRAEEFIQMEKFYREKLRRKNFWSRTQSKILDICFLQHRKAKSCVAGKGQITRTSHQSLSPIPEIFSSLVWRTLKNNLSLFQ